MIKNLMRPSVKDDWGIKELQNCILNIAQYIHELCEQNDIQYCIMGGTALGAVRHGGFIPWDDDLDIFMTPNEYIKFRDVFQKKGNHEDFYLQELGECNGMVGYAKLRMNNTTFLEDAVKDFDIHHGIYVDIMIQYHYPITKINRMWMVFWQFYLEVKSLANKDYRKRGSLVYFLLKPLGWLPKRFLLKYALTQAWKFKDDNCESFFHYYLGQPLARSIYPSIYFESYKLMDFETIKLRAPIGVNNYLSILFGDYMKIPDSNSIKWHQHNYSWSPNKPFKKVGEGNYEYERCIW